MLTVSGSALLVALAASLRLVVEPTASEPLLRSLVQLLVLCGVLGLDEQCKQVGGCKCFVCLPGMICCSFWCCVEY